MKRCKRCDAKELIGTLPSALTLGISVFAGVYVSECHIEALILPFGDFTQALSQQVQLWVSRFKLQSSSSALPACHWCFQTAYDLC